MTVNREWGEEKAKNRIKSNFTPKMVNLLYIAIELEKVVLALSCDAWLTTNMRWNVCSVHNSKRCAILLCFFYFYSFVFFFICFFLHVSAGAPFLIKLLMPKHRSLLFLWFVAFVYSIFPRLRVYVYEMWSVEYNFTLNRLCTHASDYSVIWLNDS